MNVPQAMASYLCAFDSGDHALLDELSAEEARRTDIQPSIGPQVGRLIAALVRMQGTQRALEFGTCLGYSTLWLALALHETGGRLTAVEVNPDLCLRTRETLRAAGVEDDVEMICWDAAQVAKRLEGPFDLILQDSDKALYPVMLEDSIALLRIGGVLLADDTLFQPMGISEHFSRPIHRYNEAVFNDPRLYSVILPLGDGLTLSVRTS